MSGFNKMERRGISSCMDQTLESLCVLPMHLLCFFGLLILVTSYSIHSNYKKQMQRTMIQTRLFLIILLLLVLILVMCIIISKWSHVRASSSPPPTGYESVSKWSQVRASPPTGYKSVGGDRSFPWGVALILVLVLVMVNYHSYIQSTWFRPF